MNVYKALARLEEMKPDLVIGIDEVGYGACAGPLSVGGVIMPFGMSHECIRDSKQVSPAWRERAYPIIDKIVDAWVVRDLSSSEVDLHGVKHAVDRLNSDVAAELVCMIGEDASFVLVHDGDDPINLDCLNWDNHMYFPKADGIVQAVGAASIMAKVTRDYDMVNYHSVWPHYDWDNNKGYGTPRHIEGLKKHGACILHRQSYKLVRRYGRRIQRET